MIFTAVFVAVIVILNIITTAVHSSRPMIIDMTRKQIYGITEASRELLKDITAPVEIVFFMDLDLFENRVSGGRMITQCVKSYENEFDYISIVVKDIIKYPQIADEYKASGISSFQTTNVVIHSGTSSRILQASAFFVIAESTGQYFGFAGEKQLTASILQVTSTDTPRVYFTTGHSESNPASLVSLFTTNGFIVEQIDLTKEEIDPDVKIIVICNPIKDFIPANPDDPTSKGEIDKIATYLNNFGNVMYFTSPEVGALPEIDDLLKEYGIVFNHNTMITDPKNSLYQDGLTLVAEYNVSNISAGDELTASIRKLPTPPKTIVPRAKSIELLTLSDIGNPAPVLVASSAANQTSYMSNDSETVPAPGANLLVMGQKTRYVDNEPKSQLLLACGSYDFLNRLTSGSYANSDVILNAIRIMANRRIATEISFKDLDSSALSMTVDEQNLWSRICIFLMPAIVMIIGIAIWLRRRHA